MSGRGGGAGGRGGGRGWYYKQKYGGGGRGAGGGGDHNNANRHSNSTDNNPTNPTAAAAHSDDEDQNHYTTASNTQPRGDFNALHATLQSIHNKGYKAYHDVQGSWLLPNNFTLYIDHVQGDPFASPSRCRVIMPASIAAYPQSLWAGNAARKMALCDYITRQFGNAVKSSGGDIRQQSGGWHGEKGGEMGVDMPGQNILERTSVLIHSDGAVEARFTVALPARGRTVLGDWASIILTQNLPRYCDQGLRYARQVAADVLRHVECVEDQTFLRKILPSMGLVAFVGDGSVLPRKSGDSDEPMSEREAVKFRAPESLAVTIDLPNRGAVRGLGIRQGITLICGGGFHGKSTLLEALETAIYNKLPGDGRDLIATDPNAVKIRAEDGRRVESVDISPFINNLPFKRDTTSFKSADASGSTSQAANIQEALEIGATTVLIDEDTSATNFMVRDGRMRELVSAELEPITPFVSRVRGLAVAGVSTVLVVGGTGEYFGAADIVICMNCYTPEDATERAHAIAARYGDSTTTNFTSTTTVGDAELENKHPAVKQRSIETLYSQASVSASQLNNNNNYHQQQHQNRDAIRVKTRTLHSVQFGDQDLDLSAVEQLVEVSQTRAVADALKLIQRRIQGPWRGVSLKEILQKLDDEVNEEGLDAIGGPGKLGNLVRPRKFEIAAAVNRLRSATLTQAN